jgi:hypothetical protein
MAQGRSRCQSRLAWIVVTTWLLPVPALSQTVTSAQQGRQTSAQAEILARQTLAARVSVPPDRLATVSVAPAQWRDSSLGCPERGMRYTPSLSSGHEVKLRSGEQIYVVHVSAGRAVVCGAHGDTKVPATALLSPTLKARDAVVHALATRLEIDRDRVRVRSTRPARTASPPCAAAPKMETGAAFIVDAQANGKPFRYYADDVAVVSCE